MTPDANGQIKLAIYLDKTSVEVFANDGAVTMTDLVFPPPGSDRVAVYGDDSSARMDIAVHPMDAAME